MGTKVIVVDDDAIAGGLSRDLLLEAGYDVELITESREVLDAVKARRPAIVVLDILMPGIDGLTLCHRIKRDPGLKAVKVVMVSGKSMSSERQRAKQYGADLFIVKPYNVETFVQQIGEVAQRTPVPTQLTTSEIAAPAPALSSAAEAVFQVAVWGCRSASVGPAAAPSAYGRRTSCVSVEFGEQFFIFDAGSGILPLGAEIERAGKHKELWLFLTHFHPDHVEGIGAFPCARQAGYHIRISAAQEPDKSLQDLVQEAFVKSMPEGASIEASIELYEIKEESYEILPGVHLTSFYANHPGATLAFALEAKGRKLVYCPDSELYGESATAMQDYDEKSGKLCAGADLLIHDARYTDEDYQSLKNNGHSSFASAVDFAGKNGVKRLVLFHHDNEYADAALDDIGRRAARQAAEKGYRLEVAMAREGLKVSI